jgi:molybdate transport system substrate-binding protein
MKFKRTLILISLAVFTLIPAFSGAETVRLSVAASLTDAFKALAVSYKARQPETTIQLNFASSGSLAKQISQGAPADIYVSANTKWMTYLVDAKMIDNPSVRIFVHNSLVFTGQPNPSVTSLENLTALDRIALGSPKSVPAGQYAEEAMTSAGIYAQLLEANKLIMAKDVRQALLYADRGEADGAFVYKTDALLAEKAKILFEVPTHLYKRINYPMALTRFGKNKVEARAVYEFLNSPEALATLETFGFVGPDKP